MDSGDQPTFWIADGLGAVIEWLRLHELPFHPTRIAGCREDRKTRLDYAWWFFGCGKLLPNGKCGDYENRPALCRSFEAGGDSGLCVHARLNFEAGDPSVPVC